MFEAKKWKELFSEESSQASIWRANGFLSPEEASRWRSVFEIPQVAAQWKEAGFTKEQAENYRSVGITDVYEALEGM